VMVSFATGAEMQPLVDLSSPPVQRLLAEAASAEAASAEGAALSSPQRCSL
jgi:hypothetical protein